MSQGVILHEFNELTMCAALSIDSDKKVIETMTRVLTLPEK